MTPSKTERMPTWTLCGLALCGVGLFVVLLVLIIAALSGQGDARSPQEKRAYEEAMKKYQIAKKEADDKERIQDLRIAELVTAMRDGMRDPSSFAPDSVLYMPSGAICIRYRARNGFGGLNVEHALETPQGKTFIGDFDNFAGRWNKFCANKTGDDLTERAAAVLRLLPADAN